MSWMEDTFEKIFIINLKRRPDRWEECLEELKVCGIPEAEVTRFEAFDNPENGHYGCTRSHRMLLRQIAIGPWKRVLVFEDDFALITRERLAAAGFKPCSQVWQTFCSVRKGQGSLSERLDVLATFLPNDWDVLYLGAGYGEAPISRVNEHVIRCGFMQTTSSYGITREFARKWTAGVDSWVNALPGETEEEILGRFPGPIDNVFGGFAKDSIYYVFQPRQFFQRKSYSDIQRAANSYLFSMTDTAHESMV